MNSTELINFNFRSNDQLQKAQNKMLEVKQDFKTAKGFYLRYINVLPFFETKEDAFLCINVQYYKTYSEFKYTSYDAFKQ
jgi:hypothetical protein